MLEIIFGIMKRYCPEETNPPMIKNDRVDDLHSSHNLSLPYVGYVMVFFYTFVANKTA